MLYGAPLSPNHSLIYSSLSSSETSPHNVAPTKRFPESTSFYFFFAQQSTALCPLFPQLLHSPLKLGFLLFLLSFMLSFFLLLFRQQSDALWPYFPHLLHSPLNKSPFLLYYFLWHLMLEPSLLFQFLLCLISVQLCILEPTNLFLEVLECHIRDVDITGYSHGFVVFR